MEYNTNMGQEFSCPFLFLYPILIEIKWQKVKSEVKKVCNYGKW